MRWPHQPNETVCSSVCNCTRHGSMVCATSRTSPISTPTRNTLELTDATLSLPRQQPREQAKPAKPAAPAIQGASLDTKAPKLHQTRTKQPVQEGEKRVLTALHDDDSKVRLAAMHSDASANHAVPDLLATTPIPGSQKLRRRDNCGTTLDATKKPQLRKIQ